ncbi:hypothetical protein LMG22037_05975 [Paraburkholderia phenoliruptrix]|uniref:Uncharacterized protein n=1 Tax=Paraburkholderia phenoliruptrix TaxID=252970 RepID=A0A6J5CHK7_9BURK|nr:hypothetical protein [Paraburkholderia phenoliruptrix]CAB3735533.1 hypothetical protein LMG22037_05975 [Paraburkholderia phenoliruptrix]
MDLSLDTAKAIYRHAIDPRASDGESEAWWEEVADEVRDVVAARSMSEAAAVIAWWHHDWTVVSDTPVDVAKRIRAAARTLQLKA